MEKRIVHLLYLQFSIRNVKIRDMNDQWMLQEFTDKQVNSHRQQKL